MYFKDISGLARKADVKIAGVKVGWVEHVHLVPGESMQAEAKVLILKDYILYDDAYALVRQDGLLGPKYIEIIPGDPLLPALQKGELLGKPSAEPVSIDELLQQCKKIASHVEQVTDSLKGALGGIEGQGQVQSIIDNIQAATEKISSCADRFETDFFSSCKESIEKVSNALEETALQVRDGLRNVCSVAQKVDEGTGTIGKLVNDEEAYRDLTFAMNGFKNFLTKMDGVQIVFDAHFESMLRHAENYAFEDSKGYFNMRIHPSEDYFYLMQVATSEKGFITRKERDLAYCNAKGEEIDPDTLDLDDETRLRFVFRKKRETFKRNTLKIGLQIGKVFKSVALRFGLFEGSAGVGVDIDIPFGTDKFRWVTTFELFDMNGWNRKQDRRPHLKWLNKIFILRNIYAVFGVDDFVSKRNVNVFFGAGLRFGDNDVKYFVSGFGPLGILHTY